MRFRHPTPRPPDPYEGWLETDSKGRFIMGPHAVRYRGQLLSGVPGGYLRHLLEGIRELPPVVRKEFAQAAGMFSWDASNGKAWVPIVIGNVYVTMPEDSFAIFKQELDRLMKHTGGKVGQALEMMAVCSSHTTDEELGG